MGPLWIANLVVIAISLSIFIYITVTYMRSFMVLKTRAFLGIIVFAMIFLFQSILSIVIYYNLSLRFGAFLASLLIVLNVLGMMGYIVLYRVLQT